MTTIHIFHHCHCFQSEADLNPAALWSAMLPLGYPFENLSEEIYGD